MAPAWIEGRTIYHLHALRGADGRGLRFLQQWLDHVASLGCGAVLLTPIHLSSTHGYDTVDPFRLDPRLGDEEDFDAFVRACHERDLRLILDGVFNHVGRAFPRRELLSGQCWEGHDELLELDHDKSEVLDWAVDVATHWLDRGVDGWRFDVAYTVPRPFLAELAARIRRRFSDAFLFGEMIHGDYAGLVTTGGLDSVTQYELFKAMWSSLNDGNMWELAWALDRHRQFATSFPPVTFLGNHDVTRIASNLHRAEHIEIAVGVLFTLPGVPSIYYGDEFGWAGRKHVGLDGDNTIRPPLPEAVPSGPLVELYRHWTAFRRAHPWLTTALLDVIDKTNTTLNYRVGDLAVDVDITSGLTVREA